MKNKFNRSLQKTALGACLAASISPAAFATDFSVSVENLTRGIHFTPLLVAAHTDGTALFSAGSAASAELQAMAEGGDISGLETMVDGLGATRVSNPASGLLVPGASTTANLNTDGTSNDSLSIVGMMLPTNDGFVGLNAIEIPTEAGTYTFYANGYDAGTEANDEIRGSGAVGESGFPAPGPIDTGALSAGTGGTGVNATAESFVHIHRGALGDTNSAAGESDLDSTVHRWLNPIAKITITVN